MIEEFVKQLNILYYTCIDSFPRWDDFFEDSLTNLIHQLELFLILLDDNKFYYTPSTCITNNRIAFEYVYGTIYSYVGEIKPIIDSLKPLLTIKQEWKFSLNLLSLSPEFVTEKKYDVLIDTMYTIWSSGPISNILSNMFGISAHPFSYVISIIRKYEFFEYIKPLLIRHCEYYDYFCRYNYYRTSYGEQLYKTFCIRETPPRIPLVFSSHIKSCSFKTTIFREHTMSESCWTGLSIGNTIYLCKTITENIMEFQSHEKILIASGSQCATSFK